jgi:hypothetical protein
MVVASVPLTWNHSFAWLVTGSWVCASHWPGGTPQEPDDHAEGDEGQGGKRQYGERPWNRDPTLHCPSEESEPHDQEVANTSDKLAEPVDFQASSGNVRLSYASLLPQGLWDAIVLSPSFDSGATTIEQTCAIASLGKRQLLSGMGSKLGHLLPDGLSGAQRRSKLLKGRTIRQEH